MTDVADDIFYKTDLSDIFKIRLTDCTWKIKILKASLKYPMTGI